eukprot:7825817-Pyramimonas_sp.AAC.1
MQRCRGERRSNHLDEAKAVKARANRRRGLMIGNGTHGKLNNSYRQYQNPSGNADSAAAERTRLVWRDASTVAKRVPRQPLTSSSWHLAMALLLLLSVFSGRGRPRHQRMETPMIQQDESIVEAKVPEFDKSASKEIDVCL